MGLSLTQILIVALLIILLFGRGRISALMSELAKGVRNFKKGLSEDAAPPPDPKMLELTAEKPAAPESPAREENKTV